MNKLRKIIENFKVGVDYDGRDAYLEHTEVDELTAQIKTLLKVEVAKAKLKVFQDMIKMQEDYETKLKEDRDKGIYPISFGSASGALANAGWVNYFKDQVTALNDTESMGGGPE